MLLPVDYTKLKPHERRAAREQYVHEQHGLCWLCKADLTGPPPEEITKLKINWTLFPIGFRKYPVHLQHNHESGMTEGAVHNYCNAVLWQYYGR